MFDRIVKGISRTSSSLLGSLKSVLTRGREIDQALLDDLEMSLLAGDCGIDATARIVDAVKTHRADTADALIEHITAEMAAMLEVCEAPLEIAVPRDNPFVLLIVGVNGAGKTTTIAKLGRRFREQGLSVMFAAGDTFRAAAVEQLKTWGERLDIPVVSQETGADPASVIFDACTAARARNVDLLIADTAGRLHTQSNLMAELEKVKRVIRKFDATAPHETMLIVDATMGQNALNQAQLFHEQVELNSVTLTKLDGTAKGGFIFAIQNALGLPVRYIGVGESYEDLQVFRARDFASALLADLTLEDSPAGE